MHMNEWEVTDSVTEEPPQPPSLPHDLQGTEVGEVLAGQSSKRSGGHP